MTLADRVLCAAVFAASIAAAWGARASSPPSEVRAVVSVGGREQATLPLARDARATFQGAAGAITVEVRDGAVAVTASTCPQHVCMGMGWKRRAGEVIACVPNELLVRIRGGRVGNDAIAAGGSRTGGSAASRTPDAVAR